LTDALDTLSLIAPMLGVVAVIIFAYRATKWLANRRVVRPTGQRIRVIERVPLTRDTYLALVRVKSKTYLLSVGPGRVEQIGELDGGTLQGDRKHDGEDFESLLSQRMRRAKEQPVEARARSVREQPVETRARNVREQPVETRARNVREQPVETRARNVRELPTETRARSVSRR
jgi:flagellar biogenesis protein FliO